MSITLSQRTDKSRFCYETTDGRIVFDEHPSCTEHLQAPSTEVDQPLYRCRTYAKEVIPKEWIGKRGTLTISVYAHDNHDPHTVVINFTADAVQPSRDPAPVVAG